MVSLKSGFVEYEVNKLFTSLFGYLLLNSKILIDLRPLDKRHSFLVFRLSYFREVGKTLLQTLDQPVTGSCASLQSESSAASKTPLY